MPADRSGPVAGLVLAAGSSRRMGRNKLLLELEGEPLARRTVRLALAAGLSPVVVVLGHDSEALRKALSGLGCRSVTNPHYRRGINRSLLAGVAALPGETAAVVVMLADMPLVTSEMVDALVRHYRDGNARLVVSEYGGVVAPPTLYGRSLFRELGAQGGDGCGKRVVQRHRDEAETVPWPPDVLADVDSPTDYERMKALLVAR